MESFITKKASGDFWLPIVDKVKHAVVFMDQECAECLFWTNGPLLLLSAGAKSIKMLSSFESGCSEDKKAVFICSTTLTGTTLDIIEDIIKSSSFDYSVLFTTVDEETHKLAKGSEEMVFDLLEERISLCMGDMNYTCEVLYAPIFIAPFTSQLFLSPTFNNFFPLLPHDLCAIDSMRKNKTEQLSIVRLSDVHFYSLPTSYQVQIRKLVSSFNSLFEVLNCKEELFAVGCTSRLIATQLANHASAKQRRKIAHKQASLLLIDRSLDPVAAAQHCEDSLVDKILATLPELPAHYNNIAVDMYLLSDNKPPAEFVNEEELQEIKSILLPGCLSPPSEACPQLLEDMIGLPEKKALKEVERLLREAATDEEIDVPPSEGGKFDPTEVNAIVEKFCGNGGAIMYHHNLLQLVLAASQTVSEPAFKQWMKISALEKLFVQAGEEDLVLKTAELLNEEDGEGKKSYSIDDILQLLVFVCSMQNENSNVDDESWDELASSLTLEISDTPTDHLPNGLSEALGLDQCEDSREDVDLERIQDVVDGLIQKLKDLSTSRSDLRYFKHLRSQSFGPPQYESLLSQLMKRILDSSKPDLQPDVQHVSTGLLDLLKTGFSMFKKTSKPRPSDAPIMFVFVVGGVTLSEVRDVHKIVDDHNALSGQNLQVVIGSTRIISPTNIVDKLLFANNLLPRSSLG